MKGDGASGGLRASACALVLVLAAGIAGAQGDDVVTIADGKDALPSAFADGGSVAAIEKTPGDTALRWTAGEGQSATLGFSFEPMDIRACRTLRLRIRAESKLGAALYVRLTSGDGFLVGRLPAPTAAWGLVEVALPDMRASAGFDPRTVGWIQLLVFRPTAFAIDLDDVALVKSKGGWRRTEEELRARLAGARYKVADFEDASPTNRFSAVQSVASRVACAVGHALRWVTKKAAAVGWLNFVDFPRDIRPYRELRFRARVVEGVPGAMIAKFRSAKGTLTTYLPDLGKEWRPVVIVLPDMIVDKEFDPAAATRLRLVSYRSEGFTIEIDDVEMVKAGAGWRYSAAERREMGIDTTAPRFRIADLERRAALSWLHAAGGPIEVVRVKGKRRKKSQPAGHMLRWRVDGDASAKGLTFVTVPSDIRPYRTLRLLARTDRAIDGNLLVCFQCAKGTFGSYLTGLTKRWQAFELPIPDMRATGSFEAGNVRLCRIWYYGKKSFTLEVDDIELVKGAGGWKRTEAEQITHVFGADRVRKTKQIETDHFSIWTDSSAARKKFPRALEKAHDFVLKELGLESMPGRLPIYIFQSSNLYHDFCVRQGWTLEAARATAGHAAKSYFATYYQAPGSATVTHELTHSIFHRTRGVGGGSWFQEGVAVCVENRWEKKNAAAVFAPRLRSGQFVPLAEFFVLPQLIGEADVKGGARTAGSLYEQAGAFFEFLLRGPYSETAPGAVESIALLAETGPARLKEVEKILGASIPEIEATWIAWGSKPPKPKRR